MPEIAINPRWGGQIEGEAEDIAELGAILSQSSKFKDDFSVQRLEGVPILCSLRWDDAEDAKQAKDRAESALVTLVGAINLLYGSRPLKIGTIYEFHSEGRFTMSRFTTIRTLVKPSPENRPSPAVFREVVDLAEDHEWLASALSVLGGDGNWFNAYMIIEAIERFHGGEAEMVASKFVDGPKLKLAKRMANSVRHLDKKKHTPLPRPMELGEVWGLLKTSIRALVTKLPSPR